MPPQTGSESSFKYDEPPPRAIGVGRTIGDRSDLQRSPAEPSPTFYAPAPDLHPISMRDAAKTLADLGSPLLSNPRQSVRRTHARAWSVWSTGQPRTSAKAYPARPMRRRRLPSKLSAPPSRQAASRSLSLIACRASSSHLCWYTSRPCKTLGELPTDRLSSSAANVNATARVPRRQSMPVLAGTCWRSADRSPAGSAAAPARIAAPLARDRHAASSSSSRGSLQQFGIRTAIAVAAGCSIRRTRRLRSPLWRNTVAGLGGDEFLRIVELG